MLVFGHELCNHHVMICNRGVEPGQFNHMFNTLSITLSADFNFAQSFAGFPVICANSTWAVEQAL